MKIEGPHKCSVCARGLTFMADRICSKCRAKREKKAPKPDDEVQR